MIVLCIWSFHFSVGTRLVPRYMYDSFWCRAEIGWFQYLTLFVWRWALNEVGFILDLFGQPIIARLGTPTIHKICPLYLFVFEVV